MIPPAAPERGPNGKEAEHRFFVELRERLSDDYVILHDVRLVDADEAQIDFLVVQRPLGILVIECKGRGVRLGDNATWTRKKNGRTEAMKVSPQAKAQRQMKTLIRILEERMRGAFPARPFVHGHAIAFPFADSVGPALPHDLPREILCTAGDLDHLVEWIKRAFSFWRKAARPEPARAEGFPGTRERPRRRATPRAPRARLRRKRSSRR